MDSAFEQFLDDKPEIVQRTYRALGPDVCSTFLADLLAPGRLEQVFREENAVRAA